MSRRSEQRVMLLVLRSNRQRQDVARATRRVARDMAFVAVAAGADAAVLGARRLGSVLLRAFARPPAGRYG